MPTDKEVSLQNPRMPQVGAVTTSDIQRCMGKFWDCGDTDILQEVLDHLCDGYKCPRCDLRCIKGRRRFYKTFDNYIHALYTASFDGADYHLIRIWLRTENGKPVARRYLVKLLAHEFVHHYDWHVLNLDLDHDKGFASRMADVFDLLKAI